MLNQVVVVVFVLFRFIATFVDCFRSQWNLFYLFDSPLINAIFVDICLFVDIIMVPFFYAEF